MNQTLSSDETIEKMIAEGRRVLQEAIELYKPVAVVAAFSGGNDSVVATHFAMNEFPGCVVFHADTLIGLAPAKAHVRTTAARYGWPIEIGRATPEGPPKMSRIDGRLVKFDPKRLPAGRWMDGDTYYEEFCFNFGFPGRNKPMHRRMYQRLKGRPIARLLRSLGAKKGRPVLLISGIRSDESAIRAGYRRSHALGSNNEAWVNPFYHSSAADFALYRDEFGLPSNPVKRRCGISGECCCGTFGSAEERAAYKTVDPEFDIYLSDLENRVRANGFPWGWGESPPPWWTDAKRGQMFLFDPRDEADARYGSCNFQPMCVGCNNNRR